MGINELKCTAVPMIIKACYQQKCKNPQKKVCESEKKARCQGFHVHGLGGGDGDEATNYEKRKNAEENVETRGTQTDYRESETQTVPWEAPYKLLHDDKNKKMKNLNKVDNPEILSLANTTWGNGLPAGMHEVQIINRMRMKKAWLEVLPPMDTPANIKICEAIISAIEANEWAFREAEIQFIMDSRMALMERIMENTAKIKEERTGQRMERLSKRLGQQRDKQIYNIRGKFLREVRKLNRKHRGSGGALYKLHKSDIIAKYGNAASQIYAPEMRYGFRADGRHEMLDKTLLPETYVDRPLQEDDLTKWLPTDEELYDIRSRARPQELCKRRTRWTDAKLQKLHADLEAIRLSDMSEDRRKRPSLLKRKIKVSAMPVTPSRREGAQRDSHWESSSLFIQKITRGRAIQCMMYEGRDRCRELIEELRSTHSLRGSDDASRRDNETRILTQIQEQNEKFKQNNRLCEILDSLEGKTVAGMLDMLSKEEIRLREERRAHALALLAERERTRREAEESGRRQLERNRRRELDEMFRQMVKVNQDSVEVYLEDIIREGIEAASEEDARKYVEDLADKIDASTSKYLEDSDPTKDQEMIADMVHNFLLPEVDKQMIRKKIQDRQKGYLREAHATIYKEIMNAKSMREREELSETPESFVREEFYEDEENNEEEDSTSESEIHDEVIDLSVTDKLQVMNEGSDDFLAEELYPEPDEQEDEDELPLDPSDH